MKNLLFYSFLATFSIGLYSCEQDEVTEENTSTPEETVAEAEEENPLDSLHPENLSEDLSWFVHLDIQEGFLISYTITRQDGEEFKVNVETEDPSSGGVDHPEPHFINDSTYFIPVVGGSPNGHYEMYIYESGNHEFVEFVKKE